MSATPRKRPWEILLERLLVALFRRTVRQGLRGVWVRGELPAGPWVLAANHHSWWDSYLLPVLLERWGGDFRIIVSDRRLREFGFFRLLGALEASRPRRALFALQRKEALVVFPEGELRPPGGLGSLHRGAVWLAEKAEVPLVPVAVRVVMRGQEFPEAYVVFGEPLRADLEGLERTLSRMLSELDGQIGTAPAEEPLAGFRLALAGRKSTHERMAFWGPALARLTGQAQLTEER